MQITIIRSRIYIRYICFINSLNFTIFLILIFNFFIDTKYSTNIEKFIITNENNKDFSNMYSTFLKIKINCIDLKNIDEILIK